MQITIREPGSAITHFIAMMMAVFAAVPLLVKAGVQSGQENFLAMAIFMGSMILLYGEGEPQTEEAGSYDDLCIDRRFLHTGVSHCVGR